MVIGKSKLFTITFVMLIVCSILTVWPLRVEAAGAVTHYNIDTLQKPYKVGLSYNLVIVAADSTNTTVPEIRTAALTCSDPNAILPTNPTLTTNAGGIASGGIYFGTAGTQTVTLTDTADSTIVGTLTVTVEPIHYSLLVSPTTINAGESVNVTVTALDSANSVLADLGKSGYGGSVLFSSTDSQASFPPAGTPSNLVNGTGVFNITLNTVGTQTVTITNQAFTLVNATTTAITVNPQPTATPTAEPTTEATPTEEPTSTPVATASPTVTPPNYTGGFTE